MIQMKKIGVLGVAFILLIGSLTACESRNRYGANPVFSDSSIYDSSEAEKEIATWKMSEMYNITIEKDEIEFEVDGYNVTFPACASDVIEGLDYVNYGERIFPSGTETFDRNITTRLGNCDATIVVDNNSGKDLYRGEMACYKLIIELGEGGQINLLGMNLTDTTTKDEIVQELGELDKRFEGTRYYFEKGTIKFRFDDRYRDGGLKEITFAAPGWK